MPKNGYKAASGFRKPDYYLSPSRELNENGETRRVGVEIEFAGLSHDQAAEIAQNVIGGTIDDKSPHACMLTGSEVGNIEFMLDTRFAHPNSDEEPDIVTSARNFLGSAVSGLVPSEMITDPIPFDKLHLLDAVTDALAEGGAKGTQESVAYAFGLHLNTEIASSSADYLLSVMRSMVLLEQEVRDEITPDWSRDLMHWAQSYSDSYAPHIMSQSYDPDLEELIADYIKLNPGRSYHLDMLPIFRHLRPELMNELVGDKYPASRPAFHYRLPNSGLGSVGWSVQHDWNIWVGIEDRAASISSQDLEAWREATEQ